MGPTGFDVGSAVGDPVAGRGLPRWPSRATSTANDKIAAEAAEGIVALEAMLADHAALAIA